MPFLGKTPSQLVDPEVDIDGGTIDGTAIGATSASTATVTTFTSTGIDDNATSTAITIESGGNVGIGTTNPSGIGGGADLAVSKSGGARFILNNSSRQWAIRGDSGIDDLRITARGTNDTVDVDYLTVTSTGKVGIGTSGPSKTLELGLLKAQRWQTGSTTLDLTPTSGATDQFVFNTSQNALIDFKMNGVAKASITTNGITFNGDTAAANALDDYEEGTWTPVLTGTTSGTKNLAGTYTKVGRCVTVRIGHWTAIPSGTLAGSLYITGLPFNSAGNPWGNNGAIASSGLLHIRGTTGGIGTSHAPFALIETNRIKLHDSANFGNTNVYAGQGATFGATKVSQNGLTSIIIDWEFSYMTA